MRATISDRTIEDLRDFLRSVGGVVRHSVVFSRSAIDSVGATTSPAYTVEDAVRELLIAYTAVRERNRLLEHSVEALRAENRALKERGAHD